MVSIFNFRIKVTLKSKKKKKKTPSSFHHLSNKRPPVKVLTPGAGLGRLSFEIAKKGYHCQGNEFSYFMLIPSNFFLNRFKIKLRN